MMTDQDKLNLFLFEYKRLCMRYNLLVIPDDRFIPYGISTTRINFNIDWDGYLKELGYKEEL